jgi:hypothetical protein
MQRGNILHSYYFTVICQTNFTSLTFQTCQMVRVRARAQAIQVDPMAWALPSQALAIRARARALALGSQTCRICRCRSPTCFPWNLWIPCQTCPMVRVRARAQATQVDPMAWVQAIQVDPMVWALPSPNHNDPAI